MKLNSYRLYHDGCRYRRRSYCYPDQPSVFWVFQERNTLSIVGFGRGPCQERVEQFTASGMEYRLRKEGV